MKVLFSPAKINLGLWIVGKRPDGYHNIFTIYHTVDFGDKIYLKKTTRLRVSTSSPIVPNDEENIVYKALKKFEEFTGIEPDYEVFIEKNIPVGGGLGGGSSNAATVLKAVNELEGNILSKEELFKLASTLGADVPFFLKGGCAVGEGIGDNLKFLNKSFDKDIFIIYPNIPISTRKIYSLVRDDILTKRDEIPIISKLEADLEDWLPYLENRLGDLAKEKYPILKEVLNTLEFLGYKGYISGSGSSIFAFGKPSQKIEIICKAKGWKLIKTRLK
ncbi:MAG: 4-(cytidine 5'-diphospho)-2-C-methyl-D-erythritol kinase [Persephonella sp.]|nr:MAG: 4-(cytidine 5'-diphospho)-2-C-methyl-D-erythritol kinase [Persephonella sp.]RUM61601.1 MAG: 4-(cytidine 5'-diphospho)-2-C-methyl-D-erythritol kinase [Persephonella sp.]